MTMDLLSGKQDNSHPGWFSSQVILFQCGHSSINILSEVWEPLCDGGCRGEAGHQPLVHRGRRGAAALGPAAG